MFLVPMILYPERTRLLEGLDLGVQWVYTSHMGLLTADQVEEVWEKQGMKHRCKRLRRFLIERGLGPMVVPEDVFLREIKDEFMINFLVKGVVEDGRGKQEFPPKDDGDAEGQG